jgi:hypothetical protein
MLQELYQALTATYGSVSMADGDLLSYLGMQVQVQSDGCILVNQPGYAAQLCHMFLPDKRIDLLFARFAAIYGHIWRSQFKDEDYFLPFAKKEWQAALVDFSDAVLDQAITECRNFYELPPTLPQLLQCCRKIKQKSTVYAVKQDYTPADPKLVRACLEQCRKILTK